MQKQWDEYALRTRVQQRLAVGQQLLDAARQVRSVGDAKQLGRQIPWSSTVRMGLLSTILFLLWWTWPSAPEQATINGGLARNALAMAPSLSFNNAADAGGGSDGAESAANALTILVPTATPLPATPPGAPAVVSLQVDGANVAGGLGAAAGILVATATPARIDAAVVKIEVPQIQLLPGVTINLPFGQPTPTATPAPTPTATPVPIPLAAGRLWSTFTPGPESDHFWVGRAFGGNAELLSSPSYQFGATAGGRYRTHHGVDISNPFGTPVLAATDGEVVHAGLDDTVLLGPYNGFYGNAVVIRLDRKLPVAGGELDVFLLYGHLSQVTVAVGQRVRPEEVVGMVGMTGIAIGPHLHVEIRLGANTYFNNVNPYLWMAPLQGHGAVAVRVLTADGRTWPGAYVSLVRYSGGTASWARQIITYMDVENIGPDPAWGENGAMEGVPAGRYYVIGVVNGERLSAEIEVQAGRTSFVELRTQQ
jgi:murein DD-endopeptidase MepM/ murein hydrolase activator NlpD